MPRLYTFLICILFSCAFLHAEDNILLVKTKRQVGFGILANDRLGETLSQYQAQVLRRISTNKKETRSLSALSSEPDKILVVQTSPTEKDILRTKLRQLSDVEWVEDLQPLTLFSELEIIPNDPRYPTQHHMANTMLNFLLRMPIRRSIRVAVIDSGIDFMHEDLFGNIWKNPEELPNNQDDDNNGLIDDIWGYNFYGAYKGEGRANPTDNAGHGTHIAGIIGAGINNNTGISGLHPSVELLNLRFTSDTGAGNQLDAALAIRYAIEKQVDIIVCAWGYYIANTVLKEAIDDALAHGIIVVAAMGNSGSDRMEFPAGIPGVIAVGAVSSTGELANFSSYGNHVQFVAFGVDILSTLPNNTYGTKSGTSQSAAVMAGTIARMLAAQPQLTSDQINTHLLLAADPIVYPQKNPYTGYGILNPETLFKTLNVVPEPMLMSSGWQAAVITPTPSPKGEDIWLTLLLFPFRLIDGFFHWLI